MQEGAGAGTDDADIQDAADVLGQLHLGDAGGGQGKPTTARPRFEQLQAVQTMSMSSDWDDLEEVEVSSNVPGGVHFSVFTCWSPSPMRGFKQRCSQPISFWLGLIIVN